MAAVGLWHRAARATRRLRGACQMSESRATSLLVPVGSVRGMTDLDRGAFSSDTEVSVLRLGGAKLSRVVPTLKPYLLKLPKFKPVRTEDPNERVAFLDPRKIRRLEDFGESERAILRENAATEIELRPLTIGYDYWKSDEVLRAVLPEGMDVPTSFSRVGHIVHLNLRTEQLPFKRLVGQVMLDKVPNCRTVVNKLNEIGSTYRHFAMEVLAGEEDTLATVSENGCRYKFDFATVYWNPRLATEHEKLVELLAKGDVLYDVFAGVGPFAVPAARKGCRVLANDLNPESYRWLQENVESNRVHKRVRSFNKDGREFLRKEVLEDLLERRRTEAPGREHVAMNLPGMAVEFLDVFAEWAPQAAILRTNPPTVHVYCFVRTSKNEEMEELAKILVEDHLGSPLDSDSLVTIRHVRNVAPAKEMMRVSFELSFELLARLADEPSAKKPKADTDNDTLSVHRPVVGEDGKEQGEPQDEKCVQGRRST